MLSKKKLKIIVVLLIITTISGCANNIYQVSITDEEAKSALNYSMKKDGDSYVWGGRGPNEFDCSGLITWSYKQALNKEYIFRVGNNITNDATMDDLYNWNVTLLPLEKIERGDIVFITNQEDKVTHGGLFIKWINEDTFKFINASSYYEKVIIDKWSINEKKREQWFVGAGRFKVSYE